MARTTSRTGAYLVALLVLSGALLLLRHEEQYERTAAIRLARDLAVCNELLAGEQRHLAAAARRQAEQVRSELGPEARLPAETFARVVAELSAEGIARVEILDAAGSTMATHERHQGQRLRARLVASAREGFAASGMLPFPSGFRLEAAVPILDHAGRPSAILAVGRAVDQALLRRLEAATGCRVIPAPTEALLAPAELAAVAQAPAGRLRQVAARADEVIRSRVPERDSQVLFQQLRDPSGAPAGLLALALPETDPSVRGNRPLIGGWLLLGLLAVFAIAHRDADPLAPLKAAPPLGADADSLGRCAESLNHHLNNAFAVVIGNLEILRERHAGAAGDRALDDVIDHSWQAARMLQRFQKACGRKLVSRLGEVPLAGVVARAITEVERRHGSSRRIQATGLAELRLAGREGDLEELLTELLDNAWQASAPEQPITIRAARRGHRIRLELRDEGAGMSAAIARRAAEPFFTTRGPRTAGLGLAVVDSLVFRHGGRWEIRTRPGEGCTIQLELPAY